MPGGRRCGAVRWAIGASVAAALHGHAGATQSSQPQPVIPPATRVPPTAPPFNVRRSRVIPIATSPLSAGDFWRLVCRRISSW